MKLALTLALVLLAGCSSTPTTTIKPDNSLRKKFEAAIAREILQEVRTDLPELKGSMRSTYLRQKADQFRQSVDLNVLTSAITQEYELLKYLDAAEHTRWHADSLDARIHALSSVRADLMQTEQLLLNELARIDQTLAILVETEDLNIPEHMQITRNAAGYPEDSFEGRQRYLDALEQEMTAAYSRWQHLIIRSDRGIELRGETSTKETFVYDDGVLTIGLADVKDLPDFELASIAVFYGFPGRTIFAPTEQSTSLKHLLELPGFTLGWAWYVLDLIAARDVERTLSHLYFAKLMTSLALADLRQHIGIWLVSDALNFISNETPYSTNRIRQMLVTVDSRPGYYLAAFLGKGKLGELKNFCHSDCEPALHQRIIELGPLPFDMLEERLRNEDLIQ